MFTAMKWFPFLLALCLSVLGTSLDPSSFAKKEFDGLLKACAGDASKQNAALQILRRVALGASATSATSAHEEPGRSASSFAGPFYTGTTVRVEAFYAIGRLATPAAIAFLEEAARSSTSESDDPWIGASIQIAMRDAKRLQYSSLQDQWRYLSSVLLEKSDNPFLGSTMGWAAEQLCSTGALEYLPDISMTYRRIARDTADADTQFCQERMSVVASHSDRPTALATVLTVPNAVNNRRLVRWAMRELKDDGRPESAARVDAYLKELIALPRSSPFRQAVMYNVVSSWIPPTQNPGIY